MPYAGRSFDYQLPPSIPPPPASAVYAPPLSSAAAAAALDSAAPYVPPPSYDHYYSQPPPQYHHAPPLPANAEKQSIRTIFIGGLPDDVKPREIHNLFRRLPGFDTCILKFTGKSNQAVAFASFLNHNYASGAKNELDGMVFDRETGATLHVELARSNSRTTHPQGGRIYNVIDKREKVLNKDGHVRSNDDGDDGSDEDTDNVNSDNGALSGLQSAKVNADHAHAEVNDNKEKTSSGNIRPCSTLFIANLGPSCTEEELNAELTKYTGFQALKMQRRGPVPIAFADFVDVESAASSMKSLQGTSLASSDRGDMHVEYARSKMKKG